MSGMEPGVRDYLRKILLSIILGLTWMMVNMTLGIYFGLFFIGEKFGIGNLICYIILAGSMGFLVRWLYRTWRRKFPHG
jgi:hypothetical protein